MQAKRIFDATAPLRMGIPESTNQSVPEAIIMGANDSDNISMKVASSQPVSENGDMNISSEALETGTGNLSSGLEAGPTQGAAEVHVPTPHVTDSVNNLTSIPPEGLAHAGGVHGLYDFMSLHPGVWFLFGCIFIVFLMIVREVYSKKKSR
jgi:hypothetical protein